MSSFSDYYDTLECGNKTFVIYGEICLESTFYYICEGYRIFKKQEDKFIEVKDKWVIKEIGKIFTLKVE